MQNHYTENYGQKKLALPIKITKQKNIACFEISNHQK
jgi:hypothetical protein